MRLRGAITLLVAAGVALAGCSGDEAADPTEAPTEAPTATAEATEEATETATPTATEAAPGMAMLLPTVLDLPSGNWFEQDVSADEIEPDPAIVIEGVTPRSCLPDDLTAPSADAPQSIGRVGRVFVLEEATRSLTVITVAHQFESPDDVEALKARLAEAWAQDGRWTAEVEECRVRESLAEAAAQPGAAEDVAVEDISTARDSLDGSAWTASASALVTLRSGQDAVSATSGVDLFIAAEGRYAFTMITITQLYAQDVPPLTFDPTALLALFRENVALLP